MCMLSNLKMSALSTYIRVTLNGLSGTYTHTHIILYYCYTYTHTYTHIYYIYTYVHISLHTYIMSLYVYIYIYCVAIIKNRIRGTTLQWIQGYEGRFGERNINMVFPCEIMENKDKENWSQGCKRSVNTVG